VLRCGPRVLMINVILLLSIATAVSAAGFVVIAVLWLRKLREAVGKAIGDIATRQISSSQDINETINKIHKQLGLHDQQMQTLALSHSRIKHDLGALAAQVEFDAPETEDARMPRRASDRTVH